MHRSSATSLVHDLFLPTLLFAALGGMTWAVRGCSGYGALAGCMFAGVGWGAAWWFIARDPSGQQTRRYTSGWIVLAMTMGIGIAGMRGWMQWPSFFEGKLLLDAPNNRWAPISPAYGFVWLFIAGVPWAGLGACMLAWCGSARPLRAWEWALRIACGVAGALIAGRIFAALPEVFLPLYSSLKDNYQDLATNPNLKRLMGDNRLAITHLGLYLGFLSFEALRRDWKNVLLISTVGLLNGIGWALLQNWKWSARVWPDAQFNFWRCWESSGGISIGVAFGVAYYLVNRPACENERARCAPLLRNTRPNLEWFGLYFGLIIGLGFAIKNGLKGWANIYLGNEAYWSKVFALTVFPVMLVAIALVALRAFRRPFQPGHDGDLFPSGYRLLWLTLLVLNVLAQLVTGPHTSWPEVAFALYYVLLFFITAAIVHHYHWIKSRPCTT